MKIAIYARSLSDKGSGVRQYIESMIKAIIPLLSNEDYLIILHNSKVKLFGVNKNVNEVLIKSQNKLVCDFLLAPFLLNKMKPDVIWFPHDTIPFFIKGRKVVTELDLAYFIPELKAYKIANTIYMKIMIRNACKKANTIIVISENTKNDICHTLNIPPDKIRILHLFPDPKYKVILDKNKLNDIKDKYNLPEPFILFTGSISPRKNLIRLAKAFNEISIAINIFLVITGTSSWRNKDFFELIKDMPQIRHIGFVEDDDMPYLYNLAKVYIYPSLYEGFGLPILEAQACGCPVIASNVTSIPEVGAESVYYINPYNQKEITKSIEVLVNDESLRAELIKRGYANLKRFDQNIISKSILTIIKESGDVLR